MASHLNFVELSLNGVELTSVQPTLVEQINTTAAFGNTASLWEMTPLPYLQLDACAANPDEPAQVVWEFPVTLDEGVNILEYGYSDQDILFFGADPRTIEVEFGTCVGN